MTGSRSRPIRRRAGPAGTAARDAAVAGHLQGQCLVFACCPVDDAGGRVQFVLAGELEADVAAGDPALELAGGALGHEPPAVEYRDPVRELVRLVQVLRGEEDRDSAGHEVPDDLPHRAAAARVEPGGRLVEEDQAGAADQGHRQVEPAPHAPGVGGGRLARRAGEVETVEQLGGAAPPGAASQVMQVGHQPQVLLTGEQTVHGRELAGDPDRGAHRIGIAGQVVARHVDLATVGGQQRGQDLHHGGLACAVGAEQREHRPLGHGEVDAVQHDEPGKRLLHPGGGDRQPRRGSGGDGHGHSPSSR